MYAFVSCPAAQPSLGLSKSHLATVQLCCPFHCHHDGALNELIPYHITSFILPFSFTKRGLSSSSAPLLRLAGGIKCPNISQPRIQFNLVAVRRLLRYMWAVPKCRLADSASAPPPWVGPKMLPLSDCHSNCLRLLGVLEALASTGIRPLHCNIGCIHGHISCVDLSQCTTRRGSVPAARQLQSDCSLKTNTNGCQGCNRCLW